jgi:DNA-binding protein
MAGEKENKGTIYQQLNNMLNLDGFGFQDSSTITPVTSPEKSKIVIKGNTPEEIHKKGLELEQKRALQDKFSRTTDRGFQKALQYEAARLPAYIDYEGMEYYPIISSALDLFMEEATTIGLNGKMLNIYSNKERIKTLLEDFFYDTVNVNVNLPFWVRNVCKYGDNFVLLYGERKKGITHVKQLVNYEIERFERIQNGKPLVKFKERMTGDEFNAFEIAHFRLLGDDKYLPYGSSILNKIRRVFRQLVMAEDAMLTYRIIRAGEKKVFKIDVGNIDEDDIEDYIYKVATTFKKTPQVQPNDGQIDYRFNILGNDEDYFLPVRNANTETGIETLPGACLGLDTKIELLDGRTLELNDIIREFNDDKNLWTYSINPENGLIVPSPITWAGVTRKNTEVLKITLDNDESITCTPDHKFPTKFNGKKEAKDLSIGESMWAFNKKKKIIKGGGKTKNTYEMVYDHSINDWVYTHRMVANFMKEKNLHEEFTHKITSNSLQTIHHKDFNRYNNMPQNLCYMNSKDHFYYHHDTAKKMYDTYSDETKLLHNTQRKSGLNQYWTSISDAKLVIKRKTAINNSLISRDKSNESFNNNSNKNVIIKSRGQAISLAKSTDEYKQKQSKLTKLQWENTNLGLKELI